MTCADEHAHVRRDPADALPRVAPRRRATDGIEVQCIRAAFDAHIDQRGRSSFAEIEHACRVYHAQMLARGGRL